MVGEDPEIAPRLPQDVAHHQPVENAVGVVRDDHERAVPRDVVEAAARDLELQPVALHHHRPEIAPVRDLAFVTTRPADQTGSAGRVFQRADQPARQARGAGGRIG